MSFVRALFMQRAFEVNQEEYPFDSHWMPYKDTHLHYVDEGEGIPVLMLHGNPTWSFLYRKVIKGLNGQSRAIAPDLPGFGFSGHPEGYGYTPAEHVEAISALLDHLQLERFILVVQDWGGPIGMAVATQRPEQVLGMVIGNTWCWPSSSMLRVFSWLMARRLFQHLLIEKNLFPSALMKGALEHTNKQPKYILDAYTAPFPTSDTRRGTAVFPVEINRSTAWLASLESKLGVLSDKPVELVMGLKDITLGTPKVIQKWQRHFPGAGLDEVGTANHFIQEDCPDRVTAAIERILNLQLS